ncbi:MAG: protein SCO1/2 [Lysobacterales bacterium]|jgi:protein SCO1/2
MNSFGILKHARRGGGIISLLLCISLLTIAVTAPAQEEMLPPDSIYHLQASLEDQSGKFTSLDLYQGSPVLITMFYASCPHVCPMLISTIKLMEYSLTAEERAKLRVLTISIDPDGDTPEALLETMTRHAVNDSRWTMTRPLNKDLRSIAAVLGIKYKKLPDGQFNHTTRVILLDQSGVILAKTDQIGRFDPAFLQSIKASLQ